jgi:dipeptidyl aminopeptidase/acylaminoacyl peptidase
VGLIPLISVACSEEPTGPSLGVPAFNGSVILDDSPAWSPDDQTIAFHRAFPTSDGPPGVYLVSKDGGKPRLVVAGDFLGPRFLSFSPDGRWLAGSWNLQLVLIDVHTGEVSQPTYTDNGATYPDWSPDGNAIVYSRLYVSNFPPESRDSGGIHLFHPKTGVDSVLRAEGAVAIGTYPRWSPHGTSIAYLGWTESGGIALDRVNLDGTAFKRLRSAAEGEYFDFLHWYSNPSTRDSGLVFRVGGHREDRRLTMMLDPAFGHLSRWHMDLGPYDAFSHDGEFVVQVLPSRADSIPVLWITSANNRLGIGRRQITSYSSPQ